VTGPLDPHPRPVPPRHPAEGGLARPSASAYREVLGWAGGVGQAPVVPATCPVCGSTNARSWHRRVACEACGLLWVDCAEAPLSSAERYYVRRAFDVRDLLPPQEYYVRRADEQEQS
jgi:hypothetical protein